MKCCNGSPVTRLEKESKKPKICGNGGNSELTGLNYENLNDSKEVDKRCDINCVVIEDDAELIATDEVEWTCVFNISLKESD